MSVLLARLGGDVYAVRDQCGDSPLPLALGTLEGAEIIAPGMGADMTCGRGVG